MNRRGFTLLELVVAVTLLAAIAAMIGGAIRIASASMERGEDEAARMARLKAGIDLLERAIRSADVSAIPLGEDAAPYFRGEPGRLRFLSLAPPSTAPGRVFRLICVFQAKGPSGSGLAVADASPFRIDGAEGWDGADKARVLLPGTEGLSFSYSPGPSPDGRWEWREEWDYRAAGRLPEAVRLEFSTVAGGGVLKTSLVIPIAARGGS